MASRADEIRKLFKSIPNIILNKPKKNAILSNRPNKYNNKILKEEKDLASKYCKLFHSVVDIEVKLKNLDITKEQIAKERFEDLRKEYTSFLNRAKPSLAEIAEKIDSNLEIQRKKADAISEELSETQKTIKQENKLYEAGAISNEEYVEKINPLKSNEEKLQEKYKYKQAQIKILEDAKNNKIEPEPSGKKIEIKPVGNGTSNQPPKFYKNPSIAAVLSFFYMGLGQIYNEQIGKGVVFIIIYLISIALMFVFIGFITTPILWIWGMIDAILSAKKINKTIAAS